MSPAKWRPFCLGLNVLTVQPNQLRNQNHMGEIQAIYIKACANMQAYFDSLSPCMHVERKWYGHQRDFGSLLTFPHTHAPPP